MVSRGAEGSVVLCSPPSSAAAPLSAITNSHNSPEVACLPPPTKKSLVCLDQPSHECFSTRQTAIVSLVYRAPRVSAPDDAGAALLLRRRQHVLRICTQNGKVVGPVNVAEHHAQRCTRPANDDD
mmetsp:Transcript_13921/g.44626  ORF Transcript_13921/g.44626 Transcript_13921/m.44626 type:complete len:125 (+) Transcript_13921:213-587(+)